MPFDFHLGDPVFQRILITLLVVLLAFALARLGRRVAGRYVEAPARRFRISKIIGRTAALTALLLIIGLWSPDLGGLFTILTVIGAGLAIALREVLLSFIGWVDIALRSPFERGDRVEVNGIRGDVIDIRLLHTTLMEIGNWVEADQSTGRLVHLPNSWVFQHGVYNYTEGFQFIWNELPVTVTFRSDWQAARQILLDLAEESAEVVEKQAMQQLRRMARAYLVHYSLLTPFVYVRLAENGVRLTLRYLCEARKRRGTEHAITSEMLEQFKAHGHIELAYPTVGARIYDTPQFGEAGPRFGAASDDGRPTTDGERNS